MIFRPILVASAALFLTACSDEPLAPVAAQAAVAPPVAAFNVSDARLVTLEDAVIDATVRIAPWLGAALAHDVVEQLDALGMALDNNDASLGAAAASQLLSVLEGVTNPDADVVRFLVAQVVSALPAESTAEAK